MNPLLGLLSERVRGTPLGGLLGGLGVPGLSPVPPTPSPAPGAAAAPAGGMAGGLPPSLVRSESGGDWRALNDEGYGGRGQFGAERLMDAYRAGVIPRPMDGAQYAQAPEAVQLAVEQWHRNDILGQLGDYVGTDVDGPGGIPPLTETSLLAVAHLGGTGGARRFIESGGRYDPADSNGTNLSDYARMHAGGGSASNASSGGAPVGLLDQGRVSTSNIRGGLLGGPDPLTPMPAPQRAPSIWDRLAGKPVVGGLADPDRRMRLAAALEGMTLNPNEQFISMLQEDAKERNRQERLAQVAAWLGEQPGGADLAAMLGAGLLNEEQAGAMLAQSRAPREPIITDGGLILDPETLQPIADYRQGAAGPQPIEINGQLVDPATGMVLGDYRDAQGGQDPTAAVQNYEYLVAQGVPPDQAMERAFGGGGVEVNVGGEGGPAIGTVPQGYAVIEDPNEPSGFRMVAIPGGPEDDSARLAATAGAQETIGDVVISAATRARDAYGQGFGGLLGAGASYLPGTPDAEVYRQVDVLKSNATIEALNAMREQSPTGGALGNVTEGEGRMLAARAGALDPKAPTFERDLADFTRTLLRTIHGPEAGDRIFSETYGGAPAPEAAPAATPEAAPEAPAAAPAAAPSAFLSHPSVAETALSMNISPEELWERMDEEGRAAWAD